MVGRLLGVDHGDRRIGLALSDPIPMIASPLKTILVNSNQDAINAILDIVKEYDIVLVVIGLPIGMKGNETAQTKHVQKFADDLVENGIKVAALISKEHSDASTSKIDTFANSFSNCLLYGIE